jgi:predicted Zn finger-like uncharacterized protein
LIIPCEKCATTYHLDQKKIEPFGSKVRCSRCGHIFWVEPPSFLFSEDPGLTKSPLNPKGKPPFQEEFQEEDEAAAIQLQPARKILWTLWTIAVFILIALTARFFYVQYLHPNWSMADTWAKVFFLPADPEGNQKLSLVNVKKYYRENEKIGPILIIEGEIKNGYPTLREKVKIRASLMKIGQKVVMSRDVYAGWILTSEELETLSMDEIGRLQSAQPERFSKNGRILPGKTIPFMIIFPPLPSGLTQVSIEVVAVGSQKVQSSSYRNLFLG